MTIARTWATPLTIGAFLVMAVTGVLMFFHLEIGFNEHVHEWLGWALIAGVGAHVAANWLSFKRYFVTSRLARGMVGAFALVLAISFFVEPPGEGRGSPPVMAMKAVLKAPLASVAPVSGKPLETLMSDLARAGIVLPDAQASIDSVAQGDRRLEGRAMRVVFGRG